jgi:hypothetical protein
MQLNDSHRDPIWADSTFATDLWDDPTAPPKNFGSFIAALDFEPGLLTDTLHPFDGISDQGQLAELVAATESELASLLDEPTRPTVVVPFFQPPREVTTWAA